MVPFSRSKRKFQLNGHQQRGVANYGTPGGDERYTTVHSLALCFSRIYFEGLDPKRTTAVMF
jgi:hypothetical protein